MCISFDSSWLWNWRCVANNVMLNHLLLPFSFSDFCLFSCFCVSVPHMEESFSFPDSSLELHFFSSLTVYEWLPPNSVRLKMYIHVSCSHSDIFFLPSVDWSTCVSHVYIFNNPVVMVSLSLFGFYMEEFRSCMTDWQTSTNQYKQALHFKGLHVSF